MSDSFQHISITTQGNAIGDQGVQALAGLGKMYSLATLELDLSDNQINNEGAAALAALTVCEPWPPNSFA